MRKLHKRAKRWNASAQFISISRDMYKRKVKWLHLNFRRQNSWHNENTQWRGSSRVRGHTNNALLYLLYTQIGGRYPGCDVGHYDVIQEWHVTTLKVLDPSANPLASCSPSHNSNKRFAGRIRSSIVILFNYLLLFFQKFVHRCSYGQLGECAIYTYSRITTF